MLLEIDKKLSSVLSANRCYVEDSRGLTGWGTVVSPLRGKLPFLVAFCSLLRATAMQLPTLALFWIRARSVWHFLRKRENISMTGPTEAYVGNGLEGESRKCMLWDLVDLIPRSQNPVEQVCWITVLWACWSFKYSPSSVSMESKANISILQTENRRKGLTENEVKCLTWS